METATPEAPVDELEGAGEHVPEPEGLEEQTRQSHEKFAAAGRDGDSEEETPEDETPAADPDDEDGSGEPRGSEEDVTQLSIDGSTDLSLTVGGARATSSSLRLMGGKLAVEGAFKKGEVVTLVIEARVGEVDFIDTYDDAGNVKTTERRHKARVITVSR